MREESGRPKGERLDRQWAYKANEPLIAGGMEGLTLIVCKQVSIHF